MNENRSQYERKEYAVEVGSERFGEIWQWSESEILIFDWKVKLFQITSKFKMWTIGVGCYSRAKIKTMWTSQETVELLCETGHIHQLKNH